MPYQEIYKFLKDNGLTQKDEATFAKEYSDPKKAQELYKFFADNKLTTKDSATFYNTYFGSSKKKEPTAGGAAPKPSAFSAPVFGAPAQAANQPKQQRVSFDPNAIRSYEDLLRQKASLESENAAAIENQAAANYPMANAAQGFMPTFAAGVKQSQKKYDLLPEFKAKKEQILAKEKEISAAVLPKIDELTNLSAGKYTTPDGGVDYGKIYEAASKYSKDIGGGDYTKEVIAQRMIQKESLNKLKPAIEKEADAEFKKRTGKSLADFYKQKDATVLSKVAAEQAYVENAFLKEQKAAEAKLEQDATAIFESYKPYFDVLTPNDKAEFDRLSKEYTTTVKGLAAKENARLKRIGAELINESKAKLAKISGNLTKEEIALVGDVYNTAYKKALDSEIANGQGLQRVKAAMPGGGWKLAGKSLAEGFNTAIASWGAGLVGLGMNNGFTDWMRSFQEQADRYKTFDNPLSGVNLIDPSTYTTRLMRQIGMQAPALAATFITRNPYIGG
ncbi:MAG: hypothetical protein ACRCR4_08965, partial [Thiotrichaceae bacterium]